MKIQRQFRAIKEPERMVSEGKDYYLDPYRELQPILITREEPVRQKAAALLQTRYGVPFECIRIEQPMSHYGIASPDRADIILHYPPRGHRKKNSAPLAVVECKEPGKALTEEVLTQALGYAKYLDCRYIFLTNGVDWESYFLKGQTPILLKCIPPYQEMLGRRYLPAPPKKAIHRSSLLQMRFPLTASRYLGAVIGRDTPNTYRPFLINLWECLLDETHKLPRKKQALYSVKKDYGVRYLSRGNFGGGVFTGAYRTIGITLPNGDQQLINFSLSPYCTDATASQATALLVGVDDTRNSHHALQLVVDKYLYRDGHSFVFTHSGQIGIGNIGSGKVSELKALMRKRTPWLLEGDKIVLGCLNENRLLYLSNPEVSKLIYRLIDYALIRDEYRADRKAAYNLKN